MRKSEAIMLAEKREAQTHQPHFVVKEPESFRESFLRTGFNVKSEAEMIAEFGSVENYSLNVVYMANAS